MHVVVLAGGIGGARFLTGVKAALGIVAPGRAATTAPPQPPPDQPHRITAIVNTGDDLTLHGLRVSPDLDSVMYTLGDGIDPERGWGRSGETWVVSQELAEYGAEPTWFGLGDRDIATHLVRTRMLDAGYPLSAVTEALCDRWAPGVRLLPMTDQRCETHVVVDAEPAGDSGTGRRAIHFQEWWVRYHAELPAYDFVQVGLADARPAPGAVEALSTADLVLLAPSNPVVSVGTVLAVPGLRDAVLAAPAPIVGISPIVGGAPVRGMADRCLQTIGVETSAEAVGRHYGARGDGGLLDGWLVHESDTADVPGVAVRAVPLLMTSPEATAAMATAAVELARAVTLEADRA